MSTMFHSEAQQVPQPWGRGTLLSMAAHGIIVLLAIVTFEKQHVTVNSPPAVMLEFAPEVQAEKVPLDMPIGVNQQRRVEASRAQVTPEKTETHRAVTADDGELALKKPNTPVPKPVKKQNVHKENRLNQQAVEGNATLNSRAAPLPSQKPAARTAAPVESNSEQMDRVRLSWEGLAMGILNRVKQFPTEARRREREGVATVTFTVSAGGEISGSRLDRSSGTIALDREALAMLERASPLPPPPAELLVAGRYTVTMPISFSLKNKN
ncbi:energy transducer TonB [Erwinia sp. JUb26]|uniref:energy transducer TonB family protein n=1 Tax=Erwinia sp. JUb26 TaxID=2485126 RepID=UPI000F483C9B|nr:TonB family protein [Erwinia sp. JUb26]ROR13473.1 protein TonB [Erwinia sp. JUb26]